MSKWNKQGFLYGLGFSWVSFIESIVLILTFGVYSPEWIRKYVRWYAFRSINQGKKK